METKREKEEVKCPSTDAVQTGYIEDPKDSTRNLLNLINTFSKVASYKTNTQKSVTFIYTNDKHIEKKKQGNNTIHNSLKK